MRTFLVMSLMLCLFLGGYLLMHAPAFFMVNRFDPSQGVWLSPESSRVLGIGLLVIAVGGARFVRQCFYVCERPKPGWHRWHFALTTLGLLLMGLALYSGEAGINPDFVHY